MGVNSFEHYIIVFNDRYYLSNEQASQLNQWPAIRMQPSLTKRAKRSVPHIPHFRVVSVLHSYISQQYPFASHHPESKHIGVLAIFHTRHTNMLHHRVYHT